MVRRMRRKQLVEDILADYSYKDLMTFITTLHNNHLAMKDQMHSVDPIVKDLTYVTLLVRIDQLLKAVKAKSSNKSGEITNTSQKYINTEGKKL